MVSWFHQVLAIVTAGLVGWIGYNVHMSRVDLGKLSVRMSNVEQLIIPKLSLRGSIHFKKAEIER